MKQGYQQNHIKRINTEAFIHFENNHLVSQQKSSYIQTKNISLIYDSSAIHYALPPIGSWKAHSLVVWKAIAGTTPQNDEKSKTKEKNSSKEITLHVLF